MLMHTYVRSKCSWWLKKRPHFSVILVWKFTSGSMNFTHVPSLKNKIQALNKGLLHTETVIHYIILLTGYSHYGPWLLNPSNCSCSTVHTHCCHLLFYVATNTRTHYVCTWHSYNSSLLSMSSKSMSERSTSSSGGNSPSLPSHGSVGLIFGNAAPLTGAVDPRPNERSLQNDGTKSVFFSCLYSNNIHKCFTT